MSDALDNARAALAKGDAAGWTRNGGNMGDLATALRDLIAEHERLTAPPIDDEREALATIIRKHLRFVEHMKPDEARSAGEMIADRYFRECRQGSVTEGTVERTA